MSELMMASLTVYDWNTGVMLKKGNINDAFGSNAYYRLLKLKKHSVWTIENDCYWTVSRGYLLAFVDNLL